MMWCLEHFEVHFLIVLVLVLKALNSVLEPMTVHVYMLSDIPTTLFLSGRKAHRQGTSLGREN